MKKKDIARYRMWAFGCNEIKKCPFCNEIPELYQGSDSLWYASCDRLGYCAEVPSIENGEFGLLGAISSWNKMVLDLDCV